jgi:hypothetical protein
MRRRPRIDGNHVAVVEAFRRCGASVFSTASMGDGFPDLVCGFRGVTHLVEVKDGSLSPSRRRLTDDESLWHATWGGEPVEIVGSPAQAAELVQHWHVGLEVSKTAT